MPTSAVDADTYEVRLPVSVQEAHGTWDVVDADCFCVAECSYKEHAELIADLLNKGGTRCM